MKIGLIDVDGHNFPNLALMKISAYYKDKGFDVEWYSGIDSYDIVFMSKIFSFTSDDRRVIQADKIIKGGTGYDIASKLPNEIRGIRNLDYSIYPMYKFSVQLFSRGCVRKCPFCLVPQKEGKITHTEPQELNPEGKYIEVIDNNFFANPYWRKSVEYLNSTNQHINLHGIDVRTMDEEKCNALNSMKLKGNSIHIAWDNPKDNIIPKIELMLKNNVKKYKITCYVLIGYWSTIQEDLYRVKELERLGIDAFVQPYRDFENKRIPSQYEKDFARWVNKKECFKSCDFADFSPRKGFYCREYFNN